MTCGKELYDMKTEKLLNIPNLLSGYRIIVFPLILYLIYSGQCELFLVFMAINILTDILDGAIARAFKMQTSFGARLDSIGDFLTYIVAGYGVIAFKWHELSGETFWIVIYLAAFSLPYVVSYAKFRKFPSLHLYSSKIGGFIDVCFLAYLFLFGYSSILFIVVVTWGILSFIEMTVIVLILSELKQDVRGAYWVLKSPPPNIQREQ